VCCCIIRSDGCEEELRASMPSCTAIAGGGSCHASVCIVSYLLALPAWHQALCLQQLAAAFVVPQRHLVGAHTCIGCSRQPLHATCHMYVSIHKGLWWVKHPWLNVSAPQCCCALHCCRPPCSPQPLQPPPAAAPPAHSCPPSPQRTAPWSDCSPWLSPRPQPRLQHSRSRC
jgi:hypothetical protein